MEEIKDAEVNNKGVSSHSLPNSPATHQRRSRIEEDLRMSSSFKVPHGQATLRSIRHMKTASDGSVDFKDLNVQKGLIDTAAPFESVKAAVSKFGGILDWKAHKVIALEKSKNVQSELERIEEEVPKYRSQSEAAEDAKARVLDELDRTKRLIEELKHTLEKTETGEAEAKQDSELMEQGITGDASVAAKAQVEVSKARHEAAVKELKPMKDELKSIKTEYHHLATERDFAVARADEALSAARDVEKKAEDLTNEALESARTSHLEAEERRIDVALAGYRDTNKVKEEVERLRVAVSSLKAELDRESESLAALRQKEATTAATVSALQGDLSRTQQESELVLTKEKEAREKLDELSSVLRRATEDAEQAKSVANFAREALGRTKEEAEQVKTGASAMELRLVAALKAIKASKASEKLALGAINAMQESNAKSGSNLVTLSLEEYYILSKNAYDAEERANEKAISAIGKTKDAKKSEPSNVERLEAALKVMEEKKAALKAAKEKEAAANEGKLRAEQELRNWRAERRRAVGDPSASQLPSRSTSGYLEYGGSGRKGFANGTAAAAATIRATSMRETVSYKNDEVPELKPRKKKSVFPRIVMFFARKKAQTLKQ